MNAYFQQGEARADALGNRGPLRFDDAGRLPNGPLFRIMERLQFRSALHLRHLRVSERLPLLDLLSQRSTLRCNCANAQQQCCRKSCPG